MNVRHTTHYTVVGNHLAQHRELSLLAKGLAVYIQSLPAGASVGIKAIAALHPESELRIAAAMRELEKHGYLKRTRQRQPNGTFTPRTISYNRPGAEPEPVPRTPPPPEPVRKTPKPPPPPPPGPKPVTEPKPPAPTPLPLAERDRPAAALLTNLRVHEPRLLLGERDIERLAPGVTAWLDRGATPEAVTRTLCATLPEPLAHPAGLLSHRLTALLPPPVAAAPVPALAAPTALTARVTLTSPRSPFEECNDCGRPFPGAPPADGLCRDCRVTEGRAA
ncbi:helix-turn-helix domain-containing protein [Streptomyces sp. NPDC101160]|uniref:helix-turn-helix domain-containing protein n=1 Tax=Streptomyces sp. NPDC101160 TaxID=3366118 RepID=UPI00380D195D